MKKALSVLFVLILAISAMAQTTDIETVMEIQAERELANWIESMLYPIVGDNVAIVDMTLRYPSETLKVYGSTLDTERSLPGLPVAKSSGVMPSEIAGEETYPTIVVKKSVTIYLSTKTTQEMEDFIRLNVTSWVNISDDNGDKLDVKRVLNLMADEPVNEDGSPVIQTQDYRNYILLIGAVLLFIIIVFIMVFSSRMKNLAKSMKEVNVPGLENAFRPAAVRDTSTKQRSTSKDPIAVRILPQDDIAEKSISFDFVENLSPAGCGKLIGKENPEDAAYVLSQLSPDYVSSFFALFEGNTDILLKAIIKG
jgi:flagellar biosynthesis/type III secretory pathway M-ring protein FliF/YscJ